MQQIDIFDDGGMDDQAQLGQLRGVPNLDVEYRPNFLSQEKASHLFDSLKLGLAWRQDQIKVYGKWHKIPRLQAWYGDPDSAYTYSGLDMLPNTWTADLAKLRILCSEHCGARFNSVLANLYRDGNDSMGMHCDNEPELGQEPVIASVTLGHARRFDFKHKVTGQKVQITLGNGSLLVMRGVTQQFWLHGIAKSKKAMGGRINLTFRQIHAGK